MTKKILYTLMIFTFSVFQITIAQVCTPDPQYTAPGVFPDTIEGFEDACAETTYEQLITNVVPVDTVVLPPPADPFVIDSVILTDVTGLPPGFTYVCYPTSCTYLGGTTGCAIINGNPEIQDTGTYNLIIYIDAYVEGITTPDQTILEAYSIVIKDSANCVSGIKNVEISKFIINKNSPNPFNEKTKIFFNSPAMSDIEFKVYNMLGKMVYSENLKAKPGNNMIEFFSKDLPAGVYLYSLRSDNHIVTRRMVIARD